MKIGDTTIKYSDITAVYYRKGFLKISNAIPYEESKNHQINYFLGKEIEILQNFIFFLLEKKRHICSYDKRGLNKLKVLYFAKEIGLKIPETYITGNEKSLKLILKNKCSDLITKNIYEAVHIADFNENENINSKTYKVDDDLLKATSNLFLYSLFQKEIKKDFEIRSFYLSGKFYSSAILSQSNEKTKIDFRNYDEEKPNRIVPYKIPNEIEDLLVNLFKKIKLNTGSVDLIFSNGEYYFLEINPVGQYSFISDACNYNIESYIADFLTN